MGHVDIGNLVVQVFLLDVRQRVNQPGSLVRPPVQVGPAGAVRQHQAAWREKGVNIVIMMAGQRELLEVVAALHAAGRLADLLHRRQDQPDQHADDGDHDQQLHQRKGAWRPPAAAII